MPVPSGSAPHRILKIPLKSGISLHKQVLLGVGSSITVVDEDSAQEHSQLLGSSAVTSMVVFPNGQFLAAFTQDGRLVVLLADLTRTLSEFSTQSDAQPDQMAWCGTDSRAPLMQANTYAAIKIARPAGDFADRTTTEELLQTLDI